MMEPDAIEIRVVGCLIEKQRTTPDVYPLSVNALRLACNQSTNRDPVVDYDEETVVEALRRLALRGWTRLASGAGSRARKYRHLLDEALDVDGPEVSLLAVLMLRGPQTPGQLKQRSERLHEFETCPPSTRRSTGWSSAVSSPATPAVRARRRIASSTCSARRPPADAPAAAEAGDGEAAATNGPPAADRLERIEREVAELRRQLEILRDELGGG